MSLLRLLVVLLAFSFSNFAFAEDQPRQTEKPLSSVVKSEQLANPFTDTQAPRFNFWTRDSSIRAFVIKNSEVGATCYTMRTYVARSLDKEFVLKPGVEGASYTPPVNAQQESPLTGSYTTCQPSAQFQMKTTVQRVETGSNSK
jgi:hypothetical protein